jgi:hypothetical protein
MVDRASDADERGQLQILRTATEPNTPLYAPVLSIGAGGPTSRFLDWLLRDWRK